MSVSTTILDGPAAAIDTLNLAVGEFALSLAPDDPRQPGLRLVQGGLDELYRVELKRAAGDHQRLAAALDRIGHQGSLAFRARLADAYERVA
jgi:hypothetical protein